MRATIIAIVSLAITCIEASPAWAASTNTPARLDRSNLLQTRARNGAVREGKDLSDWKRRRLETLKGMEEVMGKLPGREKRCPLDAKIGDEVDCGSYIRRSLDYASEPNCRTPAYLLVPKIAFEKKIRLPAILALHPTEMKIGYNTVVGLGGKANRDYGKELAERGYVVLATPYPIMANYNPDIDALGYQSGTMKAIWDNIRGLDLLDSLSYVKKGHYGAIGHSLGGHNAIYTAVFDSRIKAVVSSCGFDSFLDYMNGNIKGWTQKRYMPQLARYKLEDIPFDFYELIGALAPRTCFINAPKGDSNFKWQSVDRIVAAARPIYALYGTEHRLRVEHPDCAHDFPDDVRNMAFAALDESLK